MRVERVFSISSIFGTVHHLYSWISDDVDEERDERRGLKKIGLASDSVRSL